MENFCGTTGRPDPPHNCTVANLTQSWLHVKCSRAFDGGLPQEFICEVRREWNDDKVIANITGKTAPEFRVTGLEARTSYSIVIYSANVKGKSKENVLLSATTLPNVTTQSRRSVGKPSSSTYIRIFITYVIYSRAKFSTTYTHVGTYLPIRVVRKKLSFLLLFFSFFFFPPQDIRRHF